MCQTFTEDHIRMLRWTSLILLVLASSVAANATVVYDFSGAGLGTATLTLTSPITANAAFVPGPNLTCSNSCTGLEFVVDAVAAGFTQTPSQTVIWDTSDVGTFSYFAPDSFTTDGVHSSIIFDGATLTVTTTADAIPEPSTFGLLVASLLAGFALRRRH